MISSHTEFKGLYRIETSLKIGGGKGVVYDQRPTSRN